MSEESMQVLQMLSEGKITVEDANRLLEALNTPHAARPDPRPESQPVPVAAPSVGTPTVMLPGSGWTPAVRPAAPRGLGADDVVREVRTAGGKRIDIHQLSAMRGAGVDSAYVRELREAGLELRDVDIVGLRSVGVNGAYIREMREAGLAELSADTLQSLRAVGVDKAYIQAMREAGLQDLTANALIRLRATGVDGDYIREMGELDLLVEEIGAEASR